MEWVQKKGKCSQINHGEYHVIHERHNANSELIGEKRYEQNIYLIKIQDTFTLMLTYHIRNACIINVYTSCRYDVFEPPTKSQL